MAKESRIEIPEFIVREEDRKKFVEAFSGKLQACNKAYQALVEMPDLENIPNNLHDINSEAVEVFIDERLVEINSTKMLTSSQKDAAKADWEKVRKDALSYIATIKEVLAAYPDAEISVSKGEVVCTNLDELVTQHCQVKTPDGVTEWANLILDVKDAIDALWKFKQEHQLPDGDFFNLKQELEMVVEPKKLVESWLFIEWRREYRKKHPYIEGAWQTSVKNSILEQNKRLEEMRKKHLEEHPEDFVPINKRNPYENMQRESADCLGYSVEMK